MNLFEFELRVAATSARNNSELISSFFVVKAGLEAVESAKLRQYIPLRLRRIQVEGSQSTEGYFDEL